MSQEPSQKAARVNNVRARGCGWVLWNVVFWWPFHSRTHSNCGYLHQTHTRLSWWTPNINREGTPKTPFLVEKLLVVDDHYGDKESFPLGVSSIVNFPCLGRWPYSYWHVGSTNWTHNVIKRTWRSGCVLRGSWNEWEGVLGIDLIKIHYIHLLNCQGINKNAPLQRKTCMLPSWVSSAGFTILNKQSWDGQNWTKLQRWWRNMEICWADMYQVDERSDTKIIHVQETGIQC